MANTMSFKRLENKKKISNRWYIKMICFQRMTGEKIILLNVFLKNVTPAPICAIAFSFVLNECEKLWLISFQNFLVSFQAERSGYFLIILAQNHCLLCVSSLRKEKPVQKIAYRWPNCPEIAHEFQSVPHRTDMQALLWSCTHDFS